jgi:uncharacterized protein YndB with AHSA1/START domain
MSLTTHEVDSPPEAVFAVLADPDSYGHWVVGSKEILAAEGNWPTAGATFHHTQGTVGINLKDTTSVVEAQPPHHLVLEVRARPWIVSVVELSLEAVGQGRTRVRMYEHPTGGLARRVWNPVLDRLMHTRNAESLRRLGRLAAERAA